MIFLWLSNKIIIPLLSTSFSLSPRHTDLIQPQHIWPYIQQNLIQQHNNQLAISRDGNEGFYGASSGGGPGPMVVPTNDEPSNQGPVKMCLDDNRFGPAATTAIYGGIEALAASGRDNRVIAKPLPNRPTPFIAAAAGHGSLSHPHLHSLLTHCRNPYLGGGEWLELNNKHLVSTSNSTNNNNSNCIWIGANAPAQMFPLPGPGFPWAHSNRGKPRRGMMRRAVFSGEKRTKNQFSLWKFFLQKKTSPCQFQIHREKAWRSGFKCKSTSANRIAKNWRNDSV